METGRRSNRIQGRKRKKRGRKIYSLGSGEAVKIHKGAQQKIRMAMTWF